ncbi:hypothetical protein [Terriglobus aquaticus]|uniref:Uncharacterized protein n=1 Tax=Terriglobus aquaticus TaxID=940139 RepID=A0ABW9KGU6_9BACT|nr:hypothetical protein [Terriglobus aquaticus]
MKITRTITKWMTGAALAGALLFAAPKKAEAQVSFGISVGRPVYGYGYGYRPYYPAPYAYGYPAPVYGYYGRPYYRPYYHAYYGRPYGYGWRR